MLKKININTKWSVITTILEYFSDLYGVTIYLLTKSGTLEGVISEDTSAGGLFYAVEPKLRGIIAYANKKFPEFLFTEHGVSFFAVGSDYGTVVCGPVVHIKADETRLNEIFSLDSSLTVPEKIRFFKSSRYMPDIDLHRFAELSLVLNNILNRADVSVEELLLNDRTLSFGYRNVDAVPFEYNRMRFTPTTYPMELQDSLLSAVENGDVVALRRTLHSLNDWNFGFSSDSLVKSYKLTFAAFAGNVMTSAVKAGMDRDLAVHLCEYHINRADIMKTPELVLGAYEKMLFDYTSRIEDYKRRRITDVSKLFGKYVTAHLFDSVRVSDAALSIGVTPQHLCKCVKEDFGITPGKYIHNRKTEEAVRILKNGEMPLSEVWLHLGYCDQSHFNKVFREVEGKSPVEYMRAFNSP